MNDIFSVVKDQKKVCKVMEFYFEGLQSSSSSIYKKTSYPMLLPHSYQLINQIQQVKISYHSFHRSCGHFQSVSKPLCQDCELDLVCNGMPSSVLSGSPVGNDG